MATVESNNQWTNRIQSSQSQEPPSPRIPLHRLEEVRAQQGVSIRSAARQLGVEVRQAKEQEEETTDLRLSDLYRWQKVLSVPVTDLLMDPECSLSRPVMERARLVKIMKTTKAIAENAKNVATERLAATLTNQLIEIMPELAEIGPWHSVGQRRSLDELGRAAERLVAEESLTRYDWD